MLLTSLGLGQRPGAWEGCGVPNVCSHEPAHPSHSQGSATPGALRICSEGRRGREGMMGRPPPLGS